MVVTADSTRGPELPPQHALVPIPSRLRPLLKELGTLARKLGCASYAVGGCVRDWHLGASWTPDVDIAVEGDSQRLAAAVGQTWRSPVTTHAQFGTATVTLDRRGLRLDLAVCRQETYVRPAAYPRVRPGTLAEDLFRRDFTVNAMAVSLDPVGFGRLHDPSGGLGDLRGGRLRVLHPRSFLDDPSRVLRGIRFACRFGFAWEPDTERLLREAVAQGALGWLNAGRMEKELLLMAREPHPQECFDAFAAVLESGRPAGGA